jgi:hypothetical protein
MVSHGMGDQSLIIPAAFAVVNTHQSSLGPRGGSWLVFLMCNSQGRPVPQQWGHKYADDKVHNLNNIVKEHFTISRAKSGLSLVN